METQPEPTTNQPTPRGGRKIPRASGLQNASPTKPRNSHERDVEPVGAPEAPATPVTAAEPPFQPAGVEPKDDEAKKVGFYMKPSDLTRAKRAHTTTIIHTELRSWTAYVNEAVMAYTKQLEAQYNDSKPF